MDLRKALDSEVDGKVFLANRHCHARGPHTARDGDTIDRFMAS
jgi:hypothetical protein